jgi:hypothetical protein
MKKSLSVFIALTMVLGLFAGVGANNAKATITGTPSAIVQDFGVYANPVVNLNGYSAGFGLVNATAADVTSVVITLYHGTTTLATATATGLMATYPTATSLSAPFDVLGTFNYAADGNWSYSGWLAATSVIPTDAKVVVTFSDANVSTAVWGAPSGVTSIFTAAPTTLAATSVTASTATLNGKTNNAAILTSFWYGTPSHTFAATATPVLSAGWTATPNVGPIAATAVYSANLAGLTSGATYYYVAWAYDGTTWTPGATLSFITGTSFTNTPTTLAATGVTASTATLNGTTGTAVALTPTAFWYGTTSHGQFTSTDAVAFPDSTWHTTPISAAVAANTAFSANLAGLTSGATYYYVAWAYDGTTWTPGATLSFITGTSFTNTPTTLAATGVTASTATLNGTTGTAVALTPTAFWYGTTSHGQFTSTDAVAFPDSTWHTTPISAAVAANTAFSANLAGLTSGATYYYVAWAYDGTTWTPGATLSFITGTSATGTTAAKLATLKLLYKQIADVEKEIRQKVAADKRARVDLRAFATDLKTAAKYATHREVSHGVMLTEAESTKLASMQASIRSLQQELKTEERKAQGNDHKDKAAHKTVIDNIKAQIKAATAARTAYLKSVHTLARTQYSARLDTLIADAQMKLAFVQGLLFRLP